MLKQRIYILWDEVEGYSTARFYLDEESAKIALEEQYNDFWITTGKAKVQQRTAVSYIQTENKPIGKF